MQGPANRRTRPFMLISLDLFVTAGRSERSPPRAEKQRPLPQLRRQLPHTAAETCLLPAA